ncbi:MAG: lysostaphin resistance A-like protein [Bacilli bacterium]
MKNIIEQTIYFLPIDETISNIPTNFWSIVLEIVTMCLFAPIFEEIIFRFGLYEYLNKKFKSNIIIMLLTSIIFSLIHFYGIDVFVILLVISLIWNYSYFKMDNLIYPIIMHFIHNIYAMIGYIN